MGEKRIDLGLTALDELFMTEEGRQENRLPRIRQIPLDMIDDMPDHPFKVRRDDDMELLIESVREHGVITPILVRQKEDGRYETAAGHRRRMASKINGLTTIPAEVRDMTRDEAIILMCESNLQRTKILPSEKAFSYRMRLEAMKRQAGRPRKENSVPVGQNFGQTTREAIAAESPDSNTQIQRYIRLTYLIPELLKMVDEETIAFRPAVELSYLAEAEQRDLVETIGYEDATPSQSQAIKMKEMSKAGTLTMDAILDIMSQKKPNQKEKISFQTERLKPYLPKNITPKQTEEYVLKALEYYQRYRERIKERGDR